MDLALSYLKELYDSKYFEKEHFMCDGVWFENHPACANPATWKLVKQFLLKENYLVVKYPSDDDVSIMNVHIKDQIDLWWFELTDKAKIFVKQDLS